jgi:histidinol-phosphatase (PHP family)
LRKAFEVRPDMMDFHAHCEYSIDAEGEIGAYVQSALRAGLSHICFTTHCDLDPARLEHDGRIKLRGKVVDVYSDWLESYRDEVHRAASLAGPGVKVLCGLEIGYVPGIEALIERTIGGHRFDFILGGVHTLGGKDIVSPRESPAYFREKTPRQVCEEYFSYLGSAVATGLFDSIAHIDIYKRCGLEFYGDELNGAHLGLVDPVLDEMARRGLCLEINSAGYRKGLGSPYPSLDILKSARGAGIADLTFGSDCHRPEDVGRDLDKCLNLAREAGFDKVAVFEARQREIISLGDM